MVDFVLALTVFLSFMFAVNLFRGVREDILILLQTFFGLSASVLLCVVYKFVPSFKPSIVNLHWFALLLLVNVLFSKGEKVNVTLRWNPLVFLSIIFIAPLYEELFFRGVLLSIEKNIYLNAFVFASLHLLNVLVRFEKFSLFNFLYRFVVALVQAHSVLKSGSLFPAFVFHSVNNALVYISLLRRERDAHNVRRDRRCRQDHPGEPPRGIPEEERSESCGEEGTRGNGGWREDKGDTDQGKGEPES